jgi:hypothetical protein
VSLLLAGVLLPSVAGADVYWSNLTAGTIGRAKLDGSSADQAFIAGAGSPGGLAVDGSYIYWANGGAIGRAKLDGTGVDPGFITGLDNVTDVAVNGSHIYWTAWPGTVGRANLDGTGVNPSLVASFGVGGANPSSVALSPDHLYWVNTQPGSIGRAGLDGSGAVGVFLVGNYLNGGIATDESHLYFASTPNTLPFSYTVSRSTLDGSGAAPLFGAGESLNRLDVHGQHIYWTAWPGTVGRANLDGTGADPAFITGSTNPSGVAVDDSPTADPAPADLAFPATPQGSVSPPQSATITNNGSAPLKVDGFSFTGDNPDDFETGANTCQQSIQPGSACQVRVRFAPTTQGARTATLEIDSNAYPAASIALSGTGGDLPQGPPGATGETGPVGPTGDTGPTSTPPTINKLNSNRPVDLSATNSFAAVRVNCPSKDSQGRSCQVTEARARVQIRGKRTPARVSFPEQIKPGKSARVMVKVSESARRMLGKDRKSGVSILGIKVISGSGGRLNRQSVRHGLRR